MYPSTPAQTKKIYLSSRISKPPLSDSNTHALFFSFSSSPSSSSFLHIFISVRTMPLTSPFRPNSGTAPLTVLHTLTSSLSPPTPPPLLPLLFH